MKEHKEFTMSEPKADSEIEAIREALTEVIDPEIGMNVVDMGFIREIAPTEETVKIRMIFTSPFCPMAQVMVSQVQQAAKQVVDRPVEVTLGQERWDPSMMKQE